MDEGARGEGEERPAHNGEGPRGSRHERDETLARRRYQEGGHHDQKWEEREGLARAGKTEKRAAYYQRTGAPVQPVPIEHCSEPQQAKGGTEGLEHHRALVDQAYRVYGHGAARDCDGKGTAVPQHPTERDHAHGLEQGHRNAGGGKSRGRAHGAGQQSKREHHDGHARGLVVYEIAVWENPMGEPDRGAEPHAVVVLQVLVQLPQPEQLVPAHSETESGGQAHDEGDERNVTRLQPGGDVPARAVPGPRTAVMGQDAS